jgi:hypothetical protein
MKLIALIVTIIGGYLGYELSSFKINYNLKFKTLKKINLINSII